ncbi:MAG: hypothetical protein ACP5JE_03840 [Thermoplasmata archaeon]
MFTSTILANSQDWNTLLWIFLGTITIGIGILLIFSLFLIVLKLFKFNIARLKEFFQDEDKAFSMSRLLIFILVFFYCANATFMVVAYHTFVDIPYALVSLIVLIYGANVNRLPEIASAWKGAKINNGSTSNNQ